MSSNGNEISVSGVEQDTDKDEIHQKYVHNIILIIQILLMLIISQNQMKNMNVYKNIVLG